MNRILSFIMAIACLLPTGAMASAPLRDGDIDITAPSAILMEKETGEVLYEKDAHLTVDCGRQDIEHTLQRVLQALKKFASPSKE